MPARDKGQKSLQDRILDLKRKRRALILAHNYQVLEIQEIADFVGDSLQLARKSAQVSGYDMIVFAGVRFMAEMTAVLSNGVPVYLPAPDTLCPLAAWISPEKIRAKKQEHPGAPVVIYVNTTADSKVEADAICTSGNAVQLVESLGVDTVLFGPDANLADYVRRKTNVKVIDIEPRGHCYVHSLFNVAQIESLRKEHPGALVIAHPECTADVQAAADIIGSTGTMAKIIAESTSKEFIIATEMGMVEQLQAENPGKKMIPAYSGAVCRQMKKNTLQKILRVLEDRPEENLVAVSGEMIPRIKGLLEKMNRAPTVTASDSATTVAS